MDKRWTVFYITIMFTRHTHTHIKWIFEGPFSRFLSFWKCWHPLIENVRSFHHLTVVWITEQGKKTCSSSIHDDDDNNRNHHTSWWMIMLVPQQQQQQEESFSNIFLQEFQCSHHSQVSQSVLKTKKKTTRSWMKEKKYPNDLIIIGKKKLSYDDHFSIIKIITTNTHTHTHSDLIVLIQKQTKILLEIEKFINSYLWKSTWANNIDFLLWMLYGDI